MFSPRAQIWILPWLGALGLVFYTAALQAEGYVASLPAGSALSFEGNPVSGPVGNLAGVDRFGGGSRTESSESAPYPAHFAAGLIEAHLRAERVVQARELAFQELDAIQLSAEFEFEQTDRLLTVTPVEERRSSGLLLATSPHSTRTGTGPAARAVSTSRDTHWTPTGHAPLTDRRVERGSAPASARPVPLAAHTDYFSIRNGYIRKGRAQNVPPPVDSAPVLFFTSAFLISHDPEPNHVSRIYQSSKPTATPSCAEKFARGGFGAAPGQNYDQVPA